MSTNKTPNLKMNSWVGSDPVDFNEVNENFNTLDTNVYNNTNNVNSLTSQLATRASDLQERGINIMYPTAPLLGAKGDGVTDDTSTIQAIINYANSNGYSYVFLPPTTNGYKINGTIELTTGITVLGYNTKLIIDSKASIAAVFDISNQTGKIQVQGFTATTPSSTVTLSNVNFIQVHAFGGDLTVKDIYADGFQYLLKIDPNSNPAVNNLMVENVIGVNLTMGFLMSNVNKFVGRNIDTNLLNTQKNNHHYYLHNNMKDVSLHTIRVRNGWGSVFNYNDTFDTTQQPDTFSVEDLKCYSVSRLFSTTININKVRMSNVYADQFPQTADNLDLIYLSTTVIDLTIDGFYLGSSRRLFGSDSVSPTANKLSFRNGRFGRFREEMPVTNINELNMINVVYDNVIYGTSTTGSASSTSMFLRIPTNTIPLTVNVRDVVLNLKTADAGATFTSGTEMIRLLGNGDYTFENLKILTDNATYSDTLGRFLTCISTLSTTTFRLINCEIRTLSSYELNTGSIANYRKSNSYYKQTLIS